MRLDGKVAVITGGGSGLGRECGLLFTERGAKVVLMDRIPERAEQAAKAVAENGGVAVPVFGDTGNEADVEQAVQTAIDEFGKLDIMFANAGHHQLNFGKTPIEEVTKEEWEDILSTNLTGVVWSVKHAVRAMKRNEDGGAIVITGSAAALRAFPDASLYSATKGGVNGLALCLSRELGPARIRINVINPLQGMSVNFLMPRDAPVVGKSYEEAAGDAWDPMAGAAPLKLRRPPSLRDNANCVLFLVSDESGHMTGQSLAPNDGGILNNAAMVFNEGWDDDLRAGGEVAALGRK